MAMTKEEKREYDRRYYHEKTDKVKKYQLQQERLRRNLHSIREYKRKRGCKECGFSHPAALQFHHRDASEKEFNIGDATRLGWSLTRIMKEIEKCDILCANCHAIHHDSFRV